MPVEQLIRHGGKELLQRGAAALGGEAAEATWEEVTQKTAQSAWSPNALTRHSSYKQNIKSKGAKQFVEDLDPFDVNNLEELELLDPPAAARYYNLIQQAEYASMDKMGIAGDLWQQVNEETIGLGRHLEDLRAKARETHFNPEDDFISGLDEGEIDQALKVETANRIAAGERTGTSGTHVSSRTTAGTADPGPKSYGSTQRAAPYQEPEISGPLGAIEGMPNREQHHELIKAYFEPFIKKARELGSELDVINLAYMADAYGYGLGDYLAAMKMMDRIPHSVGHQDLLYKEIQPGTIFKEWTLAGEQDRILKIDNIADLTREFRNAIEQVGEPMRKEMDQWQDAWERIPSEDRLKLIQLRLARKKAGKPKSPEYKEANEIYKDFKQQLISRMEEFKTGIEDSVERQIDEKVRQMGG